MSSTIRIQLCRMKLQAFGKIALHSDKQHSAYCVRTKDLFLSLKKYCHNAEYNFADCNLQHLGKQHSVDGVRTKHFFLSLRKCCQHAKLSLAKCKFLYFDKQHSAYGMHTSTMHAFLYFLSFWHTFSAFGTLSQLLTHFFNF